MPNTYQKVDQSRSRKLIAYLHAINIEQKLVAEILGVTQATVSRKMSGASPGFYNKEIDTLEGYLGIVFESQLELEGVILLRKSDDLALEKVGRLRGLFVFFLEVPGSGRLEIKKTEDLV